MAFRVVAASYSWQNSPPISTTTREVVSPQVVPAEVCGPGLSVVRRVDRGNPLICDTRILNRPSDWGASHSMLPYNGC